MHVPYAVGIAILVVNYAVTLLFGLNSGPAGISTVIVLGPILAMPWIGAESKAIWANIFLKYDENTTEKVKE